MDHDAGEGGRRVCQSFGREVEILYEHPHWLSNNVCRRVHFGTGARFIGRPEGDWVIVSGDMRITRLPQERAAWAASGLTAFFLMKGWTNIGLWDQTWRIVRWWPRIIEQAGMVKPGAGFLIPINFGDKGKFEQIPSPKV